MMMMMMMIHANNHHVDPRDNENYKEDDFAGDDHDNQSLIINGCKEVVVMVMIMIIVCIDYNRVGYDDFTLTMILMMMM